MLARDFKDPQCVIIEGNGTRESHRGDGYKESETMYTINTVERHCVAYNGSAITCPTNASNPKPGDACHTLTDDDRNYVVLENHPADSRVTVSRDNVVQTLSGRMGTGGGNTPMVMEETVGSLCASGYQKNGTQEAANGMYVVEGSSWDGGQVSPTLTVNNANGAQRMPDKDNFNAVIEKGDLVVRRLTPTECSRLQGYPDGWMDIGDWVDSKGKTHKDADAPKYKAAGNSIALPFWQWLMDRISWELARDGVVNPTMASLFDGIGGFPLCAARAGIEPVWSSEIEEFPMAVTERHFGENGDYRKYL